MRLDRLKSTSQIALSVRKFLGKNGLDPYLSMVTEPLELRQDHVDEELALGRQIVAGGTEIDVDVDRRILGPRRLCWVLNHLIRGSPR